MKKEPTWKWGREARGLATVSCYETAYSSFEKGRQTKVYKSMWQCRKVLWIMLFQGVLIEAARCFSTVGRKQHKLMYSCFPFLPAEIP